ncbi:MAG: strawberry notch family protein [Acidobacteria bacterium]|nr:strawberry notch family protein [Acidobacteriota bacterium]
MTPQDPAQSLFDLIGDPAAEPAPPPRPEPGRAVAEAARNLVSVLEAGRPLAAPIVTTALHDAWRRLEPSGRSWNSKLCYDAAEAATVLFLRRYGRAMRDQAATPEALLAMVERVAALEPTHSHRSEHQVAFDQFSTPLALACAAFLAADVRPDATVLEPSAGTGVLAALPAAVLDDPARLFLNELSPVRHALLAAIYPDASVSKHNAEHIRDRLPRVRPDVVLMNPPFAARPTVGKRQRHVDLKHLRSAYAALAPCGRLVAVTGANCIPESTAWRDAFGSGATAPRILFAVRVPRRVYQRRGTGVETRLVVLERAPAAPADRYPALDPFAVAEDAADLVRRLAALPPRLALDPEPKDLAVEPVSRDDAGRADGSWSPWSPVSFRVPGATEHPTPLVESAAMADIAPPAPGYRPLLPPALVADGLLSDAQLESVVLAGEAHDRLLPTRYRIDPDWTRAMPVDEDGELLDGGAIVDGPLSEPVRFRQGWMLGDGTGCGKGRQAAAIVLDRWLRGADRALWISQSARLLEDARRDWREIGRDERDVFPLADYRPAQPIHRRRGILFTTYATLRTPARGDAPARLDQLVAWLADGMDEESRHAFDGVIVFDEAHAMANAAGSATKQRGEAKPSQQGLAGLRLQHALPNARIVYASATGATTVHGLAYAPRLGLWGGDATAFNDRPDFVSAMERGGVAAMEIVARDLKALGLYQARALAYHGVEIDILEHALTEPQREIWDRYAGAFRIIHENIHAALEATGVTQNGETLSPGAKSAAMSAFEQAKQRFFGHLLAAMKCPTLIKAMETDLDAGRAPVVQLVSTGEALLDRRLAELPPAEHADLSIDLTPREYVMEYLVRSFPTTLHEETVNDEGNVVAVPVRDDEGRPVESQEAVEARDLLIAELGALPAMPSAIDILTHRFGHDAIAEVTGRSRRILALPAPGGTRHAVSNRPPSANLSEAAAFMDGTKKILVFSTAGGTGRSYHADTACANQARRVHYLLEPGWRADVAIQGLGRTHRTRQASAPLFRPVTTDVKGERRFIATIARRLDSLGAITRGQRDGQASMGDDALFRAEDNLESPHALSALRLMYLSIHNDHVPGWPEKHFEEATGLVLSDSEGGLKDSLPPMPRFLNRLLALPIDEQNDLFGHFQARLDAVIQAAKDAGVYNQGVEAIAADSLAVRRRHPGPEGTEIVEIARRDALKPFTSDAALDAVRRARDASGNRTESIGLLVNGSSGRPAVALPAPSAVRDDGSLERRIRLRRPNDATIVAETQFAQSHWRDAAEDRWRALWDAEVADLPTHRERTFHLATGMLLRAWHLLPDDNLRIRRLATDDGERLIGRVLEPEEAMRLRRMADAAVAFELPAEDVARAVRERHARFALANGWELVRRLVLGRARVEIRGPGPRDIAGLKRLGAETEIVAWQTVVFADEPRVLERILARHPLKPDDPASP